MLAVAVRLIQHSTAHVTSRWAAPAPPARPSTEWQEVCRAPPETTQPSSSVACCTRPALSSLYVILSLPRPSLPCPLPAAATVSPPSPGPRAPLRAPTPQPPTPGYAVAPPAQLSHGELVSSHARLGQLEEELQVLEGQLAQYMGLPASLRGAEEALRMAARQAASLREQMNTIMGGLGSGQ